MSGEREVYILFWIGEGLLDTNGANEDSFISIFDGVSEFGSVHKFCRSHWDAGGLGGLQLHENLADWAHDYDVLSR